MKSKQIQYVWSDYLHKHPILEQLLSNGFRIFFSMLTLVEDPRIEVAFVENPREAIRPRAKHIRKVFAAGIRAGTSVAPQHHSSLKMHQYHSFKYE